MILLAMLSLTGSPATSDPCPDSLVATVSTGLHPQGVCCHPDGGTLYVAVAYGYLTVIDTADWTLEAYVPAGESPSDVCILPSGDLVFLADEAEDTLRVLETAGNTFIAEILLPYPATRILTVPPGDFVAALHGSGQMTLIDTATLEPAGTWWAGYSPGGLCTPPAGGTVYIPDRNSSSAGAFDMGSGTLSRFFVGGDSHDACALPDQDLLYLNLRDWDMLAVVSLPDNTLVGEIQDVGSSPARLCALATGGYVYVGDDQEDVVRILRTSDQTVVGSVAVGPEPRGLCSSPSGEYVFVANSGGSNLSVLGCSSTGIGTPPLPEAAGPAVGPNPCRGSAVLRLVLGEAGPVRVGVYSVDGRLLGIAADRVLPAGGVEIGIGDLPPGLVFLVVETPAGRNVLRLAAV